MSDVVLNRFPTLNQLTFEEIYNAFFSGEIVRGFFIRKMNVGSCRGGFEGFESLTLEHAHTSVLVEMNKGGWEVSQ